VLLLQGVEPQSLSGWEGDPRLLSLSQGENVTGSGGEHLAVGVLHVNDVD
jgi:hypothetical protein